MALICTSLLVSCGFPIVRTVEVTRVVRQTVVVNQLLTIVVTATPASGNPTPISSLASHRFIVWDTQQVLEAFQSAGLEVSHPRPMTSDDYELVPMLAVDGKRFFIPSICSDCGGRIMSFANPDDLAIVGDYYAQMGRVSTILFSWVFVRDNILVQLNGELPEATARLYESALDSLR